MLHQDQISAAELLKNYLGSATREAPNVDDPCFEFVVGWIALARGQDARAAYLADGYISPLRLQLDRELFLTRAQMIADRLGLPQSDGAADGDVGLLDVLSPDGNGGIRIAGAMAIKSRGLWFARTKRGVLAGPSPFIRAWSVPHG
ncbi:hypothetical protein LQG66_27245 [Bradyrhizobium ontarionense]|uniref:Uncharacterized protein n=1 Tax=Bradyrhizobium ontarionense TaxID=2898149 RepID=A0ABY3R6H9_9BRAD|nr:hypothetical protein [Bradyrhizobium sp. A19]UFZ02926.1 hypothetical protein LQG66_27245 [Bradyrhizobium sp. A19]